MKVHDDQLYFTREELEKIYGENVKKIIETLPSLKLYDHALEASDAVRLFHYIQEAGLCESCLEPTPRNTRFCNDSCVNKWNNGQSIEKVLLQLDLPFNFFSTVAKLTANSRWQWTSGTAFREIMLSGASLVESQMRLR